MKAEQRTSLRSRHYTYYEVLAFAQYYQVHRNESSPANLLAAFLKWKVETGKLTVMAQRLMVIEQTVVSYYGVSLHDVRGKRRYTELVRARQVISYLTVQHASQHQIATCLGANRNNIQFGKTKCALLMEIEPLLRKEVAEIEERLKAPFAEIDKHEYKLLNDKNDKTTEDRNTANDSGEAATMAE